jgi:hypothetical protein
MRRLYFSDGWASGLLGTEIFLAHTAEGTYPVLGEILKRCAWLNTVVRITYSGVVDIPASITYVLHLQVVFES